MTIAVMSDLHDNVANWQIIQKYLNDNSIEVLINCGDTCAPGMLKEMSKTFTGQIHTVFGNVADRELENEVVKDLANVSHHGDQGDIRLDDKRVFFNHFPDEAEKMAATGNFDLVCHGHTHLKRWEPGRAGSGQAGKITFILNPGTAGGMFQYPSFAVVDTENMVHQFIEVKL